MQMKELENIEGMLLKMKDTSELMVDLAYSALLYNNKEIAQEVYVLEEIIDKLYNKIQTIAVRETSKVNADVSLTIIRLATSIEQIADSARGIADVVLRDIEPHPILKMSILESDAIISKVNVNPGSDLANCTLGGIRLASETGMWVIAIRRSSDWIFGPNEFTKILAGDILLVRGPRASWKIVRKMAKGVKRGKIKKR
jgi:uncharacterized protein with PhoU and TrkA domain